MNKPLLGFIAILLAGACISTPRASSLVPGSTLVSEHDSALHQPPRADSEFEKSISQVEARLKGRIGVFALRDSKTVGYRAGEQFSYCSVFKWILGAAILKNAEDGRLSLTRKITYTKSDLTPHSPVTSENVGRGLMSVEDLLSATITTSDNTAANLLEPLVGGPAGLQVFVRSWGATEMRFDRTEPDMSNNTPGDPRDRTSPESMTYLLRTAFDSAKLGKVFTGPLTELDESVYDRS